MLLGRKRNKKHQGVSKNNYQWKKQEFFFHSSPFMSTLCLCGQNSAEDTEVLWPLLNRACAVSVLLFSLSLQVGWAGLEADSHHWISHSATNTQGDEEEGGTFVVMTFLCVSNHYVRALRPHFPGSSCTSAC